MPESFFGWVAFLLEKYWPLFLQGTGVTMLVAIVGTIIGFFIGLGVALLRTIPEQKSPIANVLIKIVRGLMAAYVEIFRGTPMIVQAMVMYYGFLSQMLTGVSSLWKGIIAAVIVISINTGAYMAEIIRGGIISVDNGQTEGAMSVGMTHWQIMINVVFPQAIRNIMPSIGNEFVVNIKDSSVLNVISVAELYFVTKSAAGTYLRYFEAFFIVAVIYFVLTFAVTRILRVVEKRMDGPANYEIHGAEKKSGGEQ